MSSTTGLADFAKDLSYAAGTGARRLASAVTTSGNIQAKTGVAVSTAGPGLRAALGHVQSRSSARASTAVDAGQIPAIAGHMARQTADQGAALLSGKK